MDREKITPAKIKALRWLARNGPTALFPADGPSMVIIKRLRMQGLVEACGRESGGPFSLTRFRLSAAGVDALNAADKITGRRNRRPYGLTE